MVSSVLGSLAAFTLPIVGLLAAAVLLSACGGSPWPHYWAGLANGAALVAFTGRCKAR